MSEILSKLKLDSHHKMERFGVIFICILLSFAVICTTIFLKKMEDDKVTLGSQVMYSTSFSSSRTATTGSVSQIYCSDDRTKCFVLLKFDDVKNISLNAENYRVFVTGTDLAQRNQQLLSAPSGGIYIFGSTGYMGIYLVESRGFPEQILDVIVRMSSELSVVDDEALDEAVFTDGSFKKYDQFRIYFNPGASAYTTIPCLNEGQVDIFNLYADSVTAASEMQLREDLDASLESMRAQQKLIGEYAERLERDSIVVPDAPEAIRGDEIIENEDGTLSFKPANIIATGFDFDWRSGSIREGYLDALCGNLSYPQYFTQKAAETDVVRFSVSGLKWYDHDGNDMSGITDELGTSVTIQNDITNMTKAWSDYYELKQKYQCEQLKSLLLLEVDSRDVEANATLNNNPDDFTLYQA